jgi:hypothetical protein
LLNFSDFHFFIFSKIEFFNCNRPFFSEPKKPVRTSFVSFHENRSIFIDIAIHVCNWVDQSKSSASLTAKGEWCGKEQQNAAEN